MDKSRFIAQAKQILKEAGKAPLSVENRREKAIELAALILNEARRTQNNREYRLQAQIAKMLDDPQGIAFASAITDECFRSHNCARIADQLLYLIHRYGIPKFLSFYRKIGFLAVKFLVGLMPKLIVRLIQKIIRREVSSIILPEEGRLLARHLERRKKRGLRTNLNHLSEMVLGEKEAQKRLRIYLDDLARPNVECVSIKISTICPHLNLLAWENTLNTLLRRLKALYRVAEEHTFVHRGGKATPKFVNLDMENYRDLRLTCELFRRTLDDPEFYRHSAGIALQTYLPDSYLIQQELTVWAMQRVAKGGAPIKLRLVKGANLAMERVEASIRGWPQAPYKTKADVDANFKRMIEYALQPEHASAVNIGIGSHNLFDIAYALLLRAENGVEKFVEIEMLEGMADHVRRSLCEVVENILLYCPVASGEEFHAAIAYLFRRLDENAGSKNFLRHLFDLYPDTNEWNRQANCFSLSCHSQKAVSISPRRTQNRFHREKLPESNLPFKNEPDTDWSLEQNRKWVEGILRKFDHFQFSDVPLMIGGKEAWPKENYGIGRDPSDPDKELYRFALADKEDIDRVLKVADRAFKKWSNTTSKDRSRLLADVAHRLRNARGDFIGYMVADGGKTAAQADAEISEGIDFIEYYRRQMEEWEKHGDLSFKPKGVVAVISPWNFPCSIPVGGIAAALAAGNTVIFKPSRDTAFTGLQVARLFWEAGVNPEVLQFILCDSEETGSLLIKNRRIASVILTGSTDTAEKFLAFRTDLNLIAETGGKNSMIITAMADRNLAIRDLLESAFGHAGQKCSACSLAILEKEIYDDPRFMEQLKDAAESLKRSSARDLSTDVNPLIHEPNEVLLKGLTALEEGEKWLLRPEQDKNNPNLWSPGIKLNVKKGSFTHQKELFGPVLALMRAENIKHAIELANSTRYGLTAGIHTLDEREKRYWLENIEAGNCYLNRPITGAIVCRQPFGGIKESNFGPGAKTGGPNYLTQLLKVEQRSLPTRRKAIDSAICVLGLHFEKLKPAANEMEIWNASLESYTYHFKNYFSRDHDPALLVGQDNILCYLPLKRLITRVREGDHIVDILRTVAAAIIVGAEMTLSLEKQDLEQQLAGEWLKLAPSIQIAVESREKFIQRARGAQIRFLSPPPNDLLQELLDAKCRVISEKVLANGRLELLRYVQERSISDNYHRYGNLGIRAEEKRSDVL